MMTLDRERKIQIPQSALDALGWSPGLPLAHTILGSCMTLCPADRSSMSISPWGGNCVLPLLRLVFP